MDQINQATHTTTEARLVRLFRSSYSVQHFDLSDGKKTEQEEEEEAEEEKDLEHELGPNIPKTHRQVHA